MEPFQNSIGPTIRIGQEILCLPSAEFCQHDQGFAKVNFTQQKLLLLFFSLKQKCKNAPSVAGTVLQTVTD